jgi:hypothetical protein
MKSSDRDTYDKPDSADDPDNPDNPDNPDDPDNPDKPDNQPQPRLVKLPPNTGRSFSFVLVGMGEARGIRQWCPIRLPERFS